MRNGVQRLCVVGPETLTVEARLRGQVSRLQEAPTERKIDFLCGLVEVLVRAQAGGPMGLLNVFADVLESSALRVWMLGEVGFAGGGMEEPQSALCSGLC